MAKGRDVGVDNDFMKEVANKLEPGGSAIFMLVVKATPDKVIEELQKYGGHVVQTSLSKEDEERSRRRWNIPMSRMALRITWTLRKRVHCSVQKETE